jgi:hypothetical protein
MGKNKPTLKVRALEPKRKKGNVYAVFVDYPNKTEYRLPGTDSKVRSVSLAKAKSLRKTPWLW